MIWCPTCSRFIISIDRGSETICPACGTVLSNSCPLCRLTHELITELFWDDELSICVLCRTCKVPMVVIKRHSATMTAEEDEHVYQKSLEYFGDKFEDFRTEMRHPEWGHAHYHILLNKKGGL